MDIEELKKEPHVDSGMNTLMKTNYFSANVSNMIFQYKVADLAGQVLPINERFREAVLKEINRHSPETLLNKLLDLEQCLFFTVKVFNQMNFKIALDSQSYDLEIKYDTDVKDNFVFMKSLFTSLLYKSQLIEIDDFYVNPFEIKEADKVALFPTFKVNFVRLDTANYISVDYDMLFSPIVNVSHMIEALIQKGMDRNEIQNVFHGKLVQTKYQSWAKYFKITRILFDSQLNTHVSERNSQSRPLLDYFKRKYPFIQIQNECQVLLEGVPVNNRFETIKTQEARALIPELLQLVITNGDMKELLGIDYYAQTHINPRAQTYFYINKFMAAFVDRPQIKTELFKWRVSVDKSPMSMSFQKMQFNRRSTWSVPRARPASKETSMTPPRTSSIRR